MARQSQARSTRGRASRGRQRKTDTTRAEDTPDVYEELLAEAEARDPAQFHSDRPIKRRRVGDMKAIPVNSSRSEGEDESSLKSSARQVQTVYDSSSSDESDVEWEDVDIPQAAATGPSSAALATQGDDEPLEITLGQEQQAKKINIRRRKPVTAAEKKVRLDAHKSHLLCLLSHVHMRNRWCNDDELQVCESLLVYVYTLLTIP